MRESFLSTEPYQITEEEKTAALEHLLFLKEKQDLSIKVQLFAYSQSNRRDEKKDRCNVTNAIPRVILITSCIDAS